MNKLFILVGIVPLLLVVPLVNAQTTNNITTRCNIVTKTSITCNSFITPDKIAECTSRHQNGWDMKVMYGNMTTLLNGHLVHDKLWYKIFDDYNKNCANVTGYLRP